jgi:hypothetical protein
MRNKYEANHVLYRDGVYYYVSRVPYGLTSQYDVKRLCFSLKTKSASAAVRGHFCHQSKERMCPHFNLEKDLYPNQQLSSIPTRNGQAIKAKGKDDQFYTLLFIGNEIYGA